MIKNKVLLITRAFLVLAFLVASQRCFIEDYFSPGHHDHVANAQSSHDDSHSHDHGKNTGDDEGNCCKSFQLIAAPSAVKVATNTSFAFFMVSLPSTTLLSFPSVTLATVSFGGTGPPRVEAKYFIDSLILAPNAPPSFLLS